MEIKNISISIIERLENEKSSQVRQPSIGRSEVTFEDDKVVYWIVRNSILSSVNYKRNFLNSVTEPEVAQLETLNPLDSIYRDSKLGAILVKKILGKNVYIYPDNTKSEIDIHSVSFFEPDLSLSVDAKNGFIKISNEELNFISLKEELRKWGELNELKLKAEDKSISVAERELYIRQIKLKEEEIKNLLELKKRHIVKSSALRDQPTLDAIQDAIRRTNIFNNSFIITGGPGTGKTTTLVQRITFLISPTITDYKQNLTRSEKQLLFDQSTSWIFFSPSELLRQFLRNIMIKEKLEADNERVVVWNLYRRIIFRKLRLINPETQRPFQATNETTSLFHFDSISLKKLLTDFDKHFLNLHKQKIDRVLEINTENFEWKNLGSQIKDYIKNLKTFNSIIQLFPFYDKLSNDFKEESKTFIESNEKVISNLAAELQIKIEKDQVKINAIEDVIKSFKKNLEPDNLDSFEDEVEEDETNVEFGLKIDFNKILKKLIRKLALLSFDTQLKFTPTEKAIRDLINEDVEGLDLKKIGEIEIFRKYFYAILRGYDSNVFSEISKAYKLFRKDVLVGQTVVKENSKQLLQAYISSGNKKVHVEEMDLILIIILKIIRELYIQEIRLYKNSSHFFIKECNDIFKSVVAIDEATDFSLLELTCMSYISHPQFKCVTLCGDIMQRLEDKGINSWNEYQEMFLDTQLSELKISYRQTSKLLNIAKKIYSYNFKKELDINSAYDESTKDPDPLLFINDNFEEKVNWIANRIYEIHTTYGNKLPSIAIFLFNDEEILKLQKKLKANEILIDNDINVEACMDGRLGDVQNVRLFNIKHIKGMEFESVIFVDVDDIPQDQLSLLDKYIYVGVSRASFYLAITAKKHLPENISYISSFFKNGTW